MKTWKGEQTVYAQIKRDGNYLEVVKNDAGRVRCYSSIRTDLTDQLKYLGWYQNVVRNVPAGTTLIGELWMPGHPASYVKTAIKNREALWFEMFQVPTERKGCPLEILESLCEGWGLRFIPFVRMAGVTPQQFVGNAVPLPEDVEGYVFKNSNLSEPYKWKPVYTIDCVITGYTDGKGKYLGLVGAIKVSVAGREIALVSGMDDLTRAEVSLDNDKYLGRVVEVRYQCVGTKGRLRHPAFVRWRDDKRATDCLLGQDQKLLDYHAPKQKADKRLSKMLLRKHAEIKCERR
ncbi:hypothetical protein LCGC14_0357300 [marine sediment metagenome]|uniref:DNA ligase OB-like domain-containing protein n=1 Tax=marine sediment metagenome TaxID=412755 RepID=A0A0F9VWB2_9ZZZZ